MDGNLEHLILQTLLDGAMHGYGIAERIQRADVAVLERDEGSIYPVLYRLVSGGWIRVSPGRSREDGAPRVYTLTERGRDRAQGGRP